METVRQYVTPKNIIFFVITALLLVFIAKIKDIAILFFASFVIACSLNPLVDKLSNKFNRGLSSALVLFGALAIVAGFIVPIIVMGSHQIKSFLNLLPEYVKNIETFLTSIPILKNTNLTTVDLGGIVSSASGFTSDIVSNSINLSKELVSMLVYFLAACIIIYYFMSDKDVVRKAYLSLFPSQMKDRAGEIMSSISQKIGGYVIAQAVTIISVGLIVMIGLLILRIDYAILLGLVTAIFDIVPVVGPTLALIIMILAVYNTGALKIGLVILLFLFAQWAENNLVRPYVFSKFLDLHPLIIYFFLFVTAQFLGIVGVIFAPAIAATVCVLIEELYIKNINN